MLVKATAKGYLGSLREKGDEFEVPDGTKGSWFKPVSTETVAEPAEPLKAAKPLKAVKAFKAASADDDDPI